MSTERSIPHLRDVFGIGGYQIPYQHHAYPQHHPVDPYAPTQRSSTTRMPSDQMQPMHHYNSDHSNVPNQYHHQAHQSQPYQQQLQQQHNYQHQPPPQTSAAATAAAAYPPDFQASSKSSTRKRRDNYKTLTSGDVKTLERHLSMKKTIRKKIMRDLQQAFVDDPNEFKVEHNNSDRLKSELNIEALRFGDSAGNNSDNFLVMLRDDQLQHHQRAVGVNGSSHGKDVYSGGEYSNNYRGGGGAAAGGNNQNNAGASRDYDFDGSAAAAASKARDEKPSFWKRFTFKNKSKT